MIRINEQEQLISILKDNIRNTNTYPYVIAIDGRCASGKTTMAEVLKKEFHADVVHMDDFFLRPEQRTPQRYAEPGGNVDRERIGEFLEAFRKKEVVGYRRFDCSKMELSSFVQLNNENILIVEGSYSTRPELRKYYDCTVCMDINRDEQLRRIEMRNPDKIDAFINRWIPLEEAYFDYYHTADSCDYYFNTGLESDIK